MSETKKPENIAVITSLKPDNIGTGDDRLDYSELQKREVQYSADLGDYWDVFESAEAGSAEEQKAAENLAKLYMLKTAMKIVDYAGNDQDLWNERYTVASSEIYGSPDAILAGELLQTERQALLEGPQTIEAVELSALYDRFLPEGQGSSEKGESLPVGELLSEAGEYLESQYGSTFELVDAKESYDSAAIADLLENEILPGLASQIEANPYIPRTISNVRIEIVSGANFQVDPSPSGDVAILIGEDRPPQVGEVLRATLAHEVMGHVFRGLNGFETGDPELATGLGGYEVFEEGFGVFLESAKLGHVPDHHYDRYVDIALAVGLDGGVQPSRSELARISQLRNVVRMQQQGVEVTEGVLEQLGQKAQIHVDRMYRGTRGEDTDEVHGVYTKDITYFVGFAKAAEWVSDMQKKGWELADIISYAQQGKIDPTMESHNERLAQAKS